MLDPRVRGDFIRRARPFGLPLAAKGMHQTAETLYNGQSAAASLGVFQRVSSTVAPPPPDRDRAKHETRNNYQRSDKQPRRSRFPFQFLRN